MLEVVAIALLLALLAGCAGPRAKWNGNGQKPGSRPLTHSPGGSAPPYPLPWAPIRFF